ncbi:MAG TPA: hypothetical protein VK961_27360 [Chthoniobacter sp.]|nr:hypothetical protein [Chthoniobacter sp.]
MKTEEPRVATGKVLLVNDSRAERPQSLKFGAPIEPEEKRERLRLDINYDGALASFLQRNGYIVKVFDAYEDDLCTQMRDPVQAAEALGKLIAQFAPDDILFDLDYFGDHTYGYQMLCWLKNNRIELFEDKSHPINMLVASRYFGRTELTSRESIANEFSFVMNCIDRFRMSAREIADRYFRVSVEQPD